MLRLISLWATRTPVPIVGMLRASGSDRPPPDTPVTPARPTTPPVTPSRPPVSSPTRPSPHVDDPPPLAAKGHRFLVWPLMLLLAVPLPAAGQDKPPGFVPWEIRERVRLRRSLTGDELTLCRAADARELAAFRSTSKPQATEAPDGGDYRFISMMPNGQPAPSWRWDSIPWWVWGLGMGAVLWVLKPGKKRAEEVASW